MKTAFLYAKTHFTNFSTIEVCKGDSFSGPLEGVDFRILNPTTENPVLDFDVAFEFSDEISEATKTSMNTCIEEIFVFFHDHGINATRN